MPHELKVGRHTRGIADRLSRAVDDFLDGKTTYLVVEVPFRHGKSDLVSRGLPPYFIGKCQHLQPEIIMSGYGGELVEGFSDNVKTIIRSDSYNNLFPGLEISKKRNSASKWQLEGWPGFIIAAGLGGGLTGKGGSLLICDDYCKERSEAESQTFLDSTWESFSNSFLTRMAPVGIVIVCATPWSTDDVIGRIARRMKEDPKFPQFEFLSFPARSEKYPTDFLFEERMGKEWYERQYAQLGPYAAAGLLDCNPIIRGGNMFKVDNVQIHKDASDFPDCKYVRAWDPASTAKERGKNDPDFTVGALCGRTREGHMPHVWVKDIVKGQWEAPQRDRNILDRALRDGECVTIAVEGVGGYKDAYTTIKSALLGIRTVVKVPVSGDKMVRASILEPLFEGSSMHFTQAAWDLCKHDFAAFPNGKHDDTVDAIAIAVAQCVREARVHAANLSGPSPDGWQWAMG